MNNTVILVTRFGTGQSQITDLPLQLIEKYLELLLQNNELPNAICFYADGVKLTVIGSPVLKQLKELEGKGVRLIICSTCLGAMDLSRNVQVGIVGGMPDIVEAQMKADKVISI
ncbi:MAG TPA: DsrE family protein [Anaerolineales bacterium]|nr:DsrE family protein [Anaerolineales bacterium]